MCFNLLQETKLKTAILDYLKRYHPGDTDTYTMVALKFMMYREIAQLLEDNANKALDKLKGKPLGRYYIQHMVVGLVLDIVEVNGSIMEGL